MARLGIGFYDNSLTRCWINFPRRPRGIECGILYISCAVHYSGTIGFAVNVGLEKEVERRNDILVEEEQPFDECFQTSAVHGFMG
jgi:hypothetical protein